MEQLRLKILGIKNYPLKALIVLSFTAVLFILFQANVLSSLQQSQLEVAVDQPEPPKRDKRSNPASIKLEVPGPDILRGVNPKFAAALQEEIGIKVNGTILRGVMKAHRKYYIPSDGMFACLDGKQSVAWSAVNNERCDCADGSDEPGTSACENGRFYCEPEVRFISSLRVNDGLCDCCDGSDEWKGVTLSPDVLVENEDRRAPCTDVCFDYEHTKMREDNLIREGAHFKNLYIEEGKSHVGDGNFGSRGEFFLLSQRCYVKKSPGYLYNVCPYVNATQSGKDVWLIGTGGKLEGSLESGYRLTMGNGRGDHCPDGAKRKTIITFVCGPSDHIKHISEKETCVYVAKFETPAACPDVNEIGDT